MKRFADALAIQGGACNPIAIANSIVRAITEIKDAPDYRGTAHITGDPAVRLMVQQLAFICNCYALDNAAANEPGNYGEATEACKAGAASYPSEGSTA